MGYVEFFKTPLKYIILFLISSTNIITYHYIQPWVIYYIYSFDSLNFISILYIFILFTIYDITKGTFSNLWNKFTHIFGIHVSVSLSLFLISLTNTFFCFFISTKKENINMLIIIRLFSGMFNNLHIYTVNSMFELFSLVQISKVLQTMTFIQHFISFILFFICIFMNKEKYYMLIFFFSISNIVNLILYIFKFRCKIEKKLNGKYFNQPNEIDFSEREKSSNKDQLFYQNNILYNSKEKLKGINENFQFLNNFSINNNNNNNNQIPKKNTENGSVSNKNFKRLNSDSIDNSININNKLNSMVNTSNNNIIIKDNNNLNPYNGNHKKLRINTIAGNNQLFNNSNGIGNFKKISTKKDLPTTTTNSGKKKYLGMNLSFNTNTNFSNNTPKHNNPNNSINNNIVNITNRVVSIAKENTFKKTKFTNLIIIYSFLYFINHFSIVLLIFKCYKMKNVTNNQPKTLFFILSIYHFFQMILSSINKIIMSQSIKNQKIKDLTYSVAIYLCIFSSFIFNILYTWKRIQMKILLYFIFLTLLIRNECNIVIIGYFNIKVFSNESKGQKIKSIKNISNLIASLMVFFFGIFWQYYTFYFADFINYLILYGIMTLFIILSLLIGRYGLN